MYIWLTKTQAANQATHIQMKVKYAYIEDERSARFNHHFFQNVLQIPSQQ